MNSDRKKNINEGTFRIKRLGLFGKHEPKVLQRAVWWVLLLHFGFRARDESRRLKWGDVELSKDPETGCELMLWKVERGSKTRQGDEQHQRAFYPTAQATVAYVIDHPRFLAGSMQLARKACPHIRHVRLRFCIKSLKCNHGD